MNSKNTSNLSTQSAAVLTPEQPAVSTRPRRRGKDLLLYLLLIEERNHRAYLSHRKRRLHNLIKDH